MTICYETDDNKYVQARCMAQNFTTDIAQWQGVDEKPIGNSINVVESGGVLNSLVKNTPAFASIIKFPKADLCKLYGVRELKVYAPNHLKDDEFCLIWLKVENTTLYFRIQDNTHSLNPTRTVSKTYMTIPTSGVEKIAWDYYSNTDFDVKLVIDWSIFTGGINLSINNTHIIKVYPYSDIDKDFVGITQNNENKNIGITVWNDTKYALSEGEYTNQLLHKTIKSFPNSDIPFLYGVRKMEIYAPEHLKNDEFCLCFLEIVDNTLYFRITDNTHEQHPTRDASKTYTSIPTSGIEEIVWSRYSNVDFDVKLVIDWSVFTGGLHILRNNTHIVNVYPYSDLEKDLLQSTIELSRTTLSLSSFNSDYISIFKAIRKIDIYTPYPDHEYKVRFLGYNSTNNKFTFGIFDMTDTSLGCYATKTYTYKPTSGVEEIVFDYYSSTNYYYFKIVIDWSLYNNEYYSFTRDDSNISVIPQPFDSWDGIVYGNNTDCAHLLRRAKILNGTFTLDSAVNIISNYLVTGNNCTIYCSNNARIIMGEHSHIDNIRFVGNWEQREEVKGRVPPIITMQNLEDENLDAIFGENVNIHNSLIEIQGSASMNTIIENCIFEKINKLVLTVAGNGHDKGQPLVKGNYFNSCRCGIYICGGFERIQSNEFWGCCVGLFRATGNCNLVGNTLVGCDCAMYVNNSNGNGAHSICTGIEMAHCGLCGVYYKEIGVNTGENWSGCLIGDADIIAEVANNLMFVGCYISTKVRIASGQKNSFVANNVNKVDSNPIYVVPSDTLFANNRGINQTTDNEANNI